MKACDHNWKHLGFAPEFCQRHWWCRKCGALKAEDIADKGRQDYEYPKEGNNDRKERD